MHSFFFCLFTANERHAHLLVFFAGASVSLEKVGCMALDLVRRRPDDHEPLVFFDVIIGHRTLLRTPSAVLEDTDSGGNDGAGKRDALALVQLVLRAKVDDGKIVYL